MSLMRPKKKSRYDPPSKNDGNDNLLTEDSRRRILSFLKPKELLTVASVSKTWKGSANTVAEQHLDETKVNHLVSNDWKERLQAHFTNNNKTPSSIPARCLWMAAQVLPLNKFEFEVDLTNVCAPLDLQAVGVPLAGGGSAFAFLTRDLSIIVLDTKTGKWTFVNAITGDSSPIHDMPNEGEDECPLGFLQICGEYLVALFFPDSKYSVSVWRIGSNLDFLHHIKIPAQPQLKRYPVEVVVKEGMLIFEYQCRWRNGMSLQCPPGNVRDDHRLSQSVMDQFPMEKCESFSKILRADVYDLETGKAVLDSIGTLSQPSFKKVSYSAGSLHSSQSYHWISEGRWIPDKDSVADVPKIYEVNRYVAAQQPLLVRTLLPSASVKGVYSSKNEVFAYHCVERAHDGPWWEHGQIEAFLLP
ncbi:expressed unknown protein [Seminavis robusta]|uniref:F-box domain-containing protein n=1 Tax=Seminavis robusta TaxID=568900 RepID=A0A9N8DTT3_9STRA|nr:expressed unknown protein [Seminavis robusta]|eukprot:Sro271_g104440.1 n/a (415) ;mRNA; r:12038-13282